MRMRDVAVLSGAVAMCLSASLAAQDEGRRRGGGGFGGGGRGGFQMPAALELVSLLRMEEVRKEVNLDEETYKAVESSIAFDPREVFATAEDERAGKMKEANDKAQAAMDEVLEPEAQKRLMGLLLQRRGDEAVTNDIIGKEIGLDADGKQKVVDAIQKTREEMFAGFRGGAGGGGGERPDFAAIMAEARKKNDEAVGKVLTDEQKKAVIALKGKEFKFPEGSGFGGFGGGPGGGRGRPGGEGGGPQRGQRPGGEGGGRPGGDRP